MNRRRAIVVVAGAALLLGAASPPLLAGAEAPGLGTTTTTTATPSGGDATTTSVGGFELPPGYGYLVDDTNRITVAVPSTWTDVTTSPANVDGAVVPSINAATDLDVWRQTFDAPGLQYAAFPFTADPQTLIDRYGLTQGCTTDNVVPYADGVFTGSWGRWTGCGATGEAEWHLIVASPADQAFTAAVIVQMTGPRDQQAFDVALETFNTTPSATWPASGPPLAPTTSTSTVPVTSSPPPTAASTTAPSTTAPVPVPPVTTAAVTPTTGPVSTATGPTTTTPPGVGVRLVDETNFLTVNVPADWSDQDVSNTRHDDGSERATITAAPDIDQYYDTWEGSGTHLLALPPTTEPAALLERFAYSNSCTDGGVTPFQNARFAGQQQLWTNCDGGTTRVLNVAARPTDGSFTLFVQVQQTTADDTVLNQILGSVGVVPGAVYPTATATDPLVPTGSVPAELSTAPAIALSALAAEDGSLSVAVPSAWTDTEIGFQMNDDTTDRPRIAAAPVLDEFYNEWTAPGVQLVAYPYTADPSTLLRNLGFAEQCTDGGVQTYSNGTFTGLMQTWTECGDTTSRNVMLAVSPADQSVTVYLEIQLPDQDNTPLQAVLSSLRVG
jgi:hypothetical protein